MATTEPRARAVRRGCGALVAVAALLAAGCATVGGAPEAPAPPVSARTPLQPFDWRQLEATAQNPVASDARRFLAADRQTVPAPDDGAIARQCFLHDAAYTTRTLRMAPADRQALEVAYARARPLAAERVDLANARFQLEQQLRFLDDAAQARLLKVNPRRPAGPVSALDRLVLAGWPEYGRAQRAVVHNRAVLEARERELAETIQAFVAALAGAHGRMLAAWAQAPAGTYTLELVGELEAYRQSHLHGCVLQVAGGGRPALPPEAGTDDALAAFVRAQVAQQRTSLAEAVRRLPDRAAFEHLMGRLNRTPQLRAALAGDTELAAATQSAMQRIEAAEARQRAVAAQELAAEQRKQERLRREAAAARVRDNPAPTASELAEYLAQAHFAEHQRRGNRELQRAGHGQYSVNRTVPFVGNVTLVVVFEVDSLQCTRQRGAHRCAVAYRVSSRSNLASPLAAMGVNPADRESLNAEFRWTEAGLVSPEGDAAVARRVDRVVGANNARIERDQARQSCIDSNFRQRGTESYAAARRRAEAACR